MTKNTCAPVHSLADEAEKTRRTLHAQQNTRACILLDRTKNHGKAIRLVMCIGGFHYLVGHQPIPEESPYPYGTIL